MTSSQLAEKAAAVGLGRGPIVAFLADFNRALRAHERAVGAAQSSMVKQRFVDLILHQENAFTLLLDTAVARSGSQTPPPAANSLDS